jgi:hypothetical protein
MLRLGFGEFEHPFCRFGDAAWTEADESAALGLEHHIIALGRRSNKPDIMVQEDRARHQCRSWRPRVPCNQSYSSKVLKMHLLTRNQEDLCWRGSCSTRVRACCSELYAV